jgi:hypothetical protein
LGGLRDGTPDRPHYSVLIDMANANRRPMTTHILRTNSICSQAIHLKVPEREYLAQDWIDSINCSRPVMFLDFALKMRNYSRTGRFMVSQ